MCRDDYQALAHHIAESLPTGYFVAEDSELINDSVRYWLPGELAKQTRGLVPVPGGYVVEGALSAWLAGKDLWFPSKWTMAREFADQDRQEMAMAGAL